MAEKMIVCKACGKEIAKSAKTCPHCGKKNKKPFLLRLGILVGVVAAILAVLTIVENPPVMLPKAPSVSREEYIASCETYAYADMARNPDTYKGKPSVFTGKVIQVMEKGKNVAYRVNVTQSGYSWSDTVYVDYVRSSDTESRVLDDDIITMYGNLNGIKSYKSALGATISIPWVIAYYLEIDDAASP